MSLEPHQQRVIDEKIDLSDKRAKLFAFFYSPTFYELDQDEKGRLKIQYEIMGAYVEILNQRIRAFNKETK